MFVSYNNAAYGFCKMKNISMMDVVTTLMGKGFELVGEMPDMASAPQACAEKINVNNPPASRKEQLKSYLKRLGEGEDLENVRTDFVRAFGDVEASEIMQAEQELMKEGIPLSEVQRICDVHSALFHGAATEWNRNAGRLRRPGRFPQSSMRWARS